MPSFLEISTKILTIERERERERERESVCVCVCVQLLYVTFSV